MIQIYLNFFLTKYFEHSSTVFVSQPEEWYKIQNFIVFLIDNVVYVYIYIYVEIVGF